MAWGQILTIEESMQNSIELSEVISSAIVTGRPLIEAWTTCGAARSGTQYLPRFQLKESCGDAVVGKDRPKKRNPRRTASQRQRSRANGASRTPARAASCVSHKSLSCNADSFERQGPGIHSRPLPTPKPYSVFAFTSLPGLFRDGLK